MLALRQKSLSTAEQAHRELFEADKRFLDAPDHGLSVDMQEHWATWRSGSVIDVPIDIVVRNAWIHPVTLTTLGVKFRLSTSFAGRDLIPVVRETSVGPLSATTVQLSHRWELLIDQPPTPLTPNHTSLVDVQLDVYAKFEGFYGAFELKAPQLSGRILVPAMPQQFAGTATNVGPDR